MCIALCCVSCSVRLKAWPRAYTRGHRIDDFHSPTLPFLNLKLGNGEELPFVPRVLRLHSSLSSQGIVIIFICSSP